MHGLDLSSRSFASISDQDKFFKRDYGYLISKVIATLPKFTICCQILKNIGKQEGGSDCAATWDYL